jgi:alkanesulfonate monooxygenase SsuD/methylene tetrahydromethanopterin reductase-like flavin-dependent oxidoreductase (luciferase family)
MLQHNLGRDRQYFLGIGRGLARRNFDSMSVEMDSSRERFNEVLDVLRLAFTEEIFSYAGEFFRYENVSLRPRPFDPGVILDAWAAWTSEASLRNMAERGLHPLTNPSKDLAGYRAELDLFDQVRAEHGHGPAKRPILQVHMFCCESEHEAQEKMEVWVGELVDAVLRMYELGTERFASGKGYEEYRTKGSDFGSGTKQDALERLTDKYMRESILGTPEQCIEKILHHYETVQPSELVTVATTGSQRGPEVEKSMRLFSEKVLPRVAHLREDSEVPVGVGG